MQKDISQPYSTKSTNEQAPRKFAYVPGSSAPISSEALSELQKAGYVVEAGQASYSKAYLLEHIHLPDDPKNTPQIVGWAGPSRSGTSGLLFLLAGNPRIDRAYFQPQKTILRQGAPDFYLSEHDDLVCMKEVFRSCCYQEKHDPIASFFEAGVPAEKISWITLVRDPVQNFASWWKNFPGATVEAYIKTFHYTIDFFYRYRAMPGVTMVPLVYDMLENQEERVLSALFSKLGIDLVVGTLEFDNTAIDRKTVMGQLDNPKIFDIYVRPTLERKKFVYSKNEISLPLEIITEIETQCRERFDRFYRLAKQELDL